jgi:hypothetical protein
MKYRVSAAYQRLMPDGEIQNDTRVIERTEFLDQASEEVQKAYFAAKGRVLIIDAIVSLHNYVPKSLANIQVEILK